MTPRHRTPIALTVLSAGVLLATTEPNASAAICLKLVSVPLRSMAPITTLTVPSVFRRQTAVAGSRPPGQPPIARPTAAPSVTNSRWPDRSQCRRFWTLSLYLSTELHKYFVFLSIGIRSQNIFSQRITQTDAA